MKHIHKEKNYTPTLEIDPM